MTGLELDAAIGRALGDKPVTVWCASKDGGKSMAMWVDEIVKKKMVEQFCEKNQAYSMVEKERWMAYSAHIGYSLLLRKKMRERGFNYMFAHNVGGNPEAWFGRGGPASNGTAEEEPMAVAIAAARVLGVWKDA